MVRATLEEYPGSISRPRAEPSASRSTRSARSASGRRGQLFKTGKPAFDVFSFEEAERLINAAEPEWRTLILVALKTGLRLGELSGLQWVDLDLQRGKLDVRRTIWRGVAWLPKGGQERTVDLPAAW